ncbi:hypothetical protein SteCoe_20757 [Stentor coeruleus]|uniref:Thioredoxin domain-containing protein n=1 Tax=Stentor coeruleus TaxID=5963 RepID=A0A1R2BQZ3_9CILI|nr:hypothetical protein SteCoe_20757 [Stentor coeruleus]
MEPWDEWSRVNTELQRSCEDKTPRIVLFAEKWNPFSTSVASFFQNLRGTDVFIVDTNKIYSIATELGVISTPAVVVFFKGNPVRIQRTGWEEDFKCNFYADVGSASHENYIKLVAAARLSANTGTIVCD